MTEAQHDAEKPKRRHVAAFGFKRQVGYVRVFIEPVDGEERVRVQWREIGAATPTVHSYPNTRAGVAQAKSFAKGVHDRLTAPTPTHAYAPVTVRQLFQRYLAAKGRDWKARTAELEQERFRPFELAVGANTLAHTITAEHLDALKNMLLAKGRSVNQVRLILAGVRRLYRWAVSRDVIPQSKVAIYEITFGQADRRQKPEMREFRASERLAIAAALNPRDRQQWRAHVLTVLFAYCGPRAKATMGLDVGDIDLDAPQFTVGEDGHAVARFGGRVRWRAALSKTGKEWVQPLPGPVAEALWVALGWRQFDGYTGRFVFYGVQRRTRAQALRRDPQRSSRRESLDGVVAHEKPYTYSAYLRMHHEAAERAGVTRLKYQATHAHRRGVAGDIYDATQDPRAAAEGIGDDSLQTVNKSYLLGRQDRLERLADTVTAAMAQAGTATKKATHIGVAKNRTATETLRPRTGVRGRGDKL